MGRLNDLISSLQSDRLVKIYVGEDTMENTPTAKPFVIPQSVLEDASPFFKNAFKHAGSLGSNPSGTLRFPEDDQKSWAIMLHWMRKFSLPDVEDFEDKEKGKLNLLYISCWSLGDKYQLPAFQDLIMLELLSIYDAGHPDIDQVKAAFESTPPGSKLRMLMAEEVANQLLADKPIGEIRHEDLDLCDGIVGFAAELSRAMKKGHEDMDKISCRRVHPVAQAWGLWKPFMVDGGPGQHWLWERKKDKVDG